MGNGEVKMKFLLTNFPTFWLNLFSLFSMEMKSLSWISLFLNTKKKKKESTYNNNHHHNHQSLPDLFIKWRCKKMEEECWYVASLYKKFNQKTKLNYPYIFNEIIIINKVFHFMNCMSKLFNLCTYIKEATCQLIHFSFSRHQPTSVCSFSLWWIFNWFLHGLISSERCFFSNNYLKKKLRYGDFRTCLNTRDDGFLVNNFSLIIIVIIKLAMHYHSHVITMELNGIN